MQLAGMKEASRAAVTTSGCSLSTRPQQGLETELRQGQHRQEVLIDQPNHCCHRPLPAVTGQSRNAPSTGSKPITSAKASTFWGVQLVHPRGHWISTGWTGHWPRFWTVGQSKTLGHCCNSVTTTLQLLLDPRQCCQVPIAVPVVPVPHSNLHS